MEDRFIPKTPPRSHPKRRSLTTSSPFRTPCKSPFLPRGSHKKLRVSPSPTIIRRSSNPSINRSGSSFCSTEGDRFIPSRRGMNIDICRKVLLSDDCPKNLGNEVSRSAETNTNNANVSEEKAQTPAETPVQKEYKRRMLSSLCDIPLNALDEDCQPRGVLNFGTSNNNENNPNNNNGRSPWRTNRLRLENPYAHDSLRVLQQFESIDDTFSSTMRNADVINRKIPSQPCRILDAPDLVDDYYLNLISWSSDNILAVALAHCVYLWNAGTGEIQHLTTIEGDDDYVTSVSWCTGGQSKYLGIGTNSNRVQLWDTEATRLVRTLSGHSGRVASMAWNQNWLSSGGRDSLIIQHDVRSRNHIVSRYKAHEQEVCGLKWNEDGTSLASGGNENYLCIWDASMSSRSRNNDNFSTDITPRLVLKEHKAAVKALDWCHYNRNVLASGGGTADRSIKLWNSNSGAMLKSIDTGSQVCSILWSKHQRELCSSHGFSENQLILWKYGSRSSLTKVKELTGHTHRILSLACSPDGSTVVSAAADESLRFWNIFGSAPSRRSSVLPMGDLSFGMPVIR